MSVRNAKFKPDQRFSLYVQWVAKDPRFLHADREDTGQTEVIHRLI